MCSRTLYSQCGAPGLDCCARSSCGGRLQMNAAGWRHACPPCCRTLLLQLEEERKKLVEAINVTFGHLGQVGAAVMLYALL